MGTRNQFLATGALSIICINLGILFSWPSYTFLRFGSENTTLSRPMTETELSLFMSLPSIGALFITPFTGYLMDTIGRKYLTIIVAALNTATWIIRIAFSNVEIVLFSCLLAGAGSCGNLVAGVFICEFAQESIRGALTSAPSPFSALGLLISFWAGGTLDYYTLNYMCLALSLMSVVAIFFLKESPTYLLRKGLKEESAKSIAFYRNVEVDSIEVKRELETIKRTLEMNLDANATKKQMYLVSVWRFAKRSKSTQRAFTVCFILAVLIIFQGLPVVQVYSVPLFKEAVPNLSSTLCAIMVAATSCVASSLSGYLSDISGRRALMIYGSLASGLCCIVLGSQLQYRWGPQWLTAVLIVLYIGTIALGAISVHFVLTAELFLPEIRGLATVLILETRYAAAFVLLFTFTPLVNLIGLAPVFYIFAGFCFTTVIYAFFMLPETKMLPVDAIQKLFHKDSNTRNEYEEKLTEN